MDEDIYENAENIPDVPIKSDKDKSLSGYDSLKTGHVSSRSTYIEPDVWTNTKSEQNSNSKVLKIVLAVLIILALFVALVLAVYAVIMYKHLDLDSISNTDVFASACKERPCKNNGKCVTIIQGGYYCICGDYKYYGRHCENELAGELPVLYPRSCQNIKQNNPKAASGIYVIQLTDKKFPVYCDQETEGGGWTLAWRYGFTNYENFGELSNAVTPIPFWSLSFRTANVIPSTTPPLGEDEKGAVNFKLWKDIGSEFLVKSNINNWIKCNPIDGSLVELKYGTIRCTLVQTVNNCSSGNKTPTMIDTHTSYQSGPILKGTTSTSSLTRYTHNMYNFDGSTTAGIPEHDPCQESGLNQTNNVDNPFGAVYLR